MRTQTRVSILGICCIMMISLWFMVSPVWGSMPQSTAGESQQRVYDMAGLFSEQEIADMEAKIVTGSKEAELDIVVVTTEDAMGKTTEAFADDFYDQGGFGYGINKDGILFLIDMDNRELTLSTSGSAIRLFTDSRIERILDDVYEGAANDDFADSVYQFLSDVSYYSDQGIVSDQHNYDTETGIISRHKSIRWYEVLIALAVSGFAGVSACLGVKNQYSMKKEKSQAANYLMAYRANSNFVYDNQTDNLIDKVVTSTVIPRNTSGGSGGSGFSSSSSGRSSTHRSSSGRSHGGGSRRF